MSDAAGFDQLVGPFRGELRAHCYRMLGSVDDADDAVQETLLRAWQALSRFEDRGSIRPWLYKIATNRCLTQLANRARRALPTDLSPGAPLTETEWLQPWPHALGAEDDYLTRESIELAFVAALQHLGPLQRAVLVLREVLDFSAREVADLLDTTVPSVNSALQRARKALAPQESVTQQQTLRTLGDKAVRTLADEYATAWQRGDVDKIVAMLADDAKFSMPPLPEWYQGRDAIKTFLQRGPLTSHWRFLPTRANGQLAFGTYLWDDEKAAYVPGGLDLVTLRGTQITEVVSFLTADLTQFGLPDKLPEDFPDSR